MSGQDVEFDGEEVKLGRTAYIVPPLALAAVKKYAARIQTFHQLQLDEQMDLAGDVAFAALKRNYPDITRERVDELIDTRNMGEVFDACMRVSGFARQQPGNTTGGASQSTGQPSTP